MAGVLGHKVAEDYAGADAYDEVGECEYKSTIGKNINATYNGISVQDTWEEQEEYILKNKIGKYENHYYARYNGGKIAEVWRLSAKDVLSLIMPKIKKQYPKKQKGFGKDPRIGVSIPMRDIITHGERIK